MIVFGPAHRANNRIGVRPRCSRACRKRRLKTEDQRLHATDKTLKQITILLVSTRDPYQQHKMELEIKNKNCMT